MKHFIFLILIIFNANIHFSAQSISNVSVIDSKYGISPDDIIYEESENFNYVQFRTNPYPIYFNGELIDEGGLKNFDGSDDHFYIAQMLKDNSFVRIADIYTKGEKSGFSYNVAQQVASGMVVQEDKIYVYGSARLTDSLFFNKRFHNCPK
ncbi:MAG: hypothetical protein R2766_13465 [Saprospiraceae bacterium]